MKDIKRMIDLMQKVHDLQINNDILHKALNNACHELYKYTGDSSKTNPDNFIAQIKEQYGY